MYTGSRDIYALPRPLPSGEGGSFWAPEKLFNIRIDISIGGHASCVALHHTVPYVI